MFENLSVEDLASGFGKDEAGTCVCIHCGEKFEAGRIYSVSEGLALAEFAAREHVEKVHGGAFRALMGLGSSASGLPEIQEKVLRLLYEGKGDREIAQALGGKSESTVRNHRYNLKRRAGEARVFLALMSLLEGGKPESEEEGFIEYPLGMPTKDERAAVTGAEATAIEARCLKARPEGGLEIVFWPRKQKEKLVVLRRVAELFERGKSYAEPDVNAILMPVYGDHVTIRRYLIEYRFLDRKADGSSYWRV
jgi:hypothetical protein